MENILSQDVSRIESKYHEALELRHRLEITQFKAFMNKMLELQYSFNGFIGIAKSKAIGIVFPTIIDGIQELLEFATDDLSALHSEMNKYHEAYFKSPDYTHGSTGLDRIHSTVSIEMHLLRKLSIDIELYLMWWQKNEGMTLYTFDYDYILFKLKNLQNEVGHF